MSTKNDDNKSLTGEGPSSAQLLFTDIIPVLNNAYNIGNISLRWAIGYINQLIASTITATTATISNALSCSTFSASSATISTSCSCPTITTTTIQPTTSTINVTGNLATLGLAPSNSSQFVGTFSTPYNDIVGNTVTLGTLSPISSNITLTGNIVGNNNTRNVGSSATPMSNVYATTTNTNNIKAISTTIRIESNVLPSTANSKLIGDLTTPFNRVCATNLNGSTLGGLSGDTEIVLFTNIEPNTDKVYYLGTTSKRFSQGHFEKLQSNHGCIMELAYAYVFVTPTTNSLLTGTSPTITFAGVTGTPYSNTSSPNRFFLPYKGVYNIEIYIYNYAGSASFTIDYEVRDWDTSGTILGEASIYAHDNRAYVNFVLVNSISDNVPVYVKYTQNLGADVTGVSMGIQVSAINFYF